MSLLGRIFIVIIAVLSLLYLGAEATLNYHQTNWRETAHRQQHQYRQIVEKKNEQIATLEAKANDLNDSMIAAMATIAKHKDEAKREADRALDFSRDKDKLTGQVDNLTAATKSQANDNAELTRRVGSLEKRQQQLVGELNTANENRERAEGQVARLLQQKTALEKDLGQLRKSYAVSKQKALDLQLVLEELERKGVPVGTLVVNHKPMKPIEAAVAGVDASTDPPVVLLTAGRDQGVERGYEFTLFRGETFVAKVVVTRVMADSCGARVLFTADGQTIRSGDRAGTRVD